MSQLIDFSALTSVIVAGILLGAGLPALFAVGVKSLVPASGATQPSPVRKIFAYVCFGICALAILGGVAFLAYGGHS